MRRGVPLSLACCFLVLALAQRLVARPPEAVEANRLIELSFKSEKTYPDPFNTVDLDCVFTTPAGTELRVPAFWAGEGTWRARYSSPQVGRHAYRTVCSDRDNAGLHGVTGSVDVKAYRGDNPLYRHGPLRVSKDRRWFEHHDGKSFYWLGDTWWMGLTRRLKWPDEFQALASDRRTKGFNVIQVIAGLYPDMPAFDERGRGDDGYPWERDYGRIRPEYFKAADSRLMYLADQGFVPCIVGAWGYHMPLLGPERLKKHWRYVVARYGALPVVWCVAGESMMPYYLSKTPKEDIALQRHQWSEITAYLRRLDPFDRLITIHPTGGDRSRNMVEDPQQLDFEMLQTGHGDRGSLPGTIRLVRESLAATPTMPTVNAEVCYEGILNTCHADVQRLIAWSCLLSGEAGHTYGANGIWQVNRKEKPYGPSPHGGNWGNTPWDEAMNLPGSRQIGIAKRLLEPLPFNRLEPHPEWAEFVTKPKAKFEVPYAAGIPRRIRVIYVPKAEPILLNKLDADYSATWLDPQTGKRSQIELAGQSPARYIAVGTVTARLVESEDRPGGEDIIGRRAPLRVNPPTGVKADWVLILEARDKGAATQDDQAAARSPIALHPDNPKYFQFRGRPLALITASEHYGSVVNRAFDFERYLADAADKKQTLTRTFLLFRELQSTRNPSSPVKPESSEYVAPYPRVGPGKALDGEPIYDLDEWNKEYFDRLHKFLDLASRLDIVVELTLFSNTYADSIWALNPLNAANNRQHVGAVVWQNYTSLKDAKLVERQRTYARRIVAETCGYDNVYYEICNEPGGGIEGQASVADVDAWQTEIARVVREELLRHGSKHLIFGQQAFSYTPQFTQPLDASFNGPLLDAVNVHPLPNTRLGGRSFQLGNFMSKELMLEQMAAFCRASQQFPKPCVMDEDNTASLYRDSVGWTIHRKRAWISLLSQAHYDYIDFSITIGSEAGTRESQRHLRRWMRHLSEFFHSFDFVHARPLHDWFEQPPAGCVGVCLGKPGEDYIAYLADAREVGDGKAGKGITGSAAFKLPPGTYDVRSYGPMTGEYSPVVRVRGGADAVHVRLPDFKHDIALRVTRSEASGDHGPRTSRSSDAD